MRKVILIVGGLAMFLVGLLTFGTYYLIGKAEEIVRSKQTEPARKARAEKRAKVVEPEEEEEEFEEEEQIDVQLNGKETNNGK